MFVMCMYVKLNVIKNAFRIFSPDLTEPIHPIDLKVFVTSPLIMYIPS